jgi:hypothetical protein
VFVQHLLGNYPWTPGKKGRGFRGSIVAFFHFQSELSILRYKQYVRARLLPPKIDRGGNDPLRPKSPLIVDAIFRAFGSE